VARERQLVERQMQELVIAQKGLEDLWASRAGDGQRVWSFLGRVIDKFYGGTQSAQW
jgi:hypothetical protein